jgi:hypothetical protein
MKSVGPSADDIGKNKITVPVKTKIQKATFKY